MSITSQYFSRHRAKANGILFAGAALGSVILPPLLEYLIEEYGLRGAFLIISGIAMNTVVASALLRDPPTHKNRRRNRQSDAAQNDVQNELMEQNENGYKAEKVDIKTDQRRPSIKDIFLSSVKSRFFYAIVISAQSSGFALVAFHATIPGQALAVGLDIHEAPFIISAASIADLLGRLVIGYIIDKKWVQLSTSYSISLFIAAIFILSIALIQKPSFALLTVFSVLYSIGYGSSYVHFPLLVSHYMSPDKLPLLYSAYGVVAVLPVFMTAPISVYFFKTYGSYSGVFVLMALFFTLPAVAWLILSIINWRRMRNCQVAGHPPKM